jgi:hypothetical protein
MLLTAPSKNLFQQTARTELNVSATRPSNKDGSGVMSDGNEARTLLQEKLVQARRLLHQVSDLTTIQGLRAFIADLEIRLRDLDPK